MGGLPAAVVGYEIASNGIYDYIAANGLPQGYRGVLTVLKRIEEATKQAAHYASSDAPFPLSDTSRSYTFICCHANSSEPVECEDLMSLKVPENFEKVVKEMFGLDVDAPIKRIFLPYAMVFSSSEFRF